MSNTVLEYLPSNISRIIQKQKYWMRNEVIEIRMRVNQALQLLTIDREVFIKNQNDYYIISQEDVEKAFVILTQNSLYAVERQLSEGFITIEGGHRVGFTGQAVIKEGKIYTIKNINSLNYRITRQVSGIGRKVIKKIYNKYTDTIFNTLIIAPPLCGKTTLLRDLVYLISEGDRQSGINGKKIAVIDERSEIAGAYNGIAQNKIGSRTDLLDNCPKAEGIMILIRSMSPELIAFDEIGRDEDVQAVREAVNAGVSLLTTVHGQNMDTIEERPSIKKLLKTNAFQRFIILSRKNGIGTIEGVFDGSGREVV